MVERGLGNVLRPILYVGLAVLLHGLLFLIPWKKFEGRDPGTARGVRVKMVQAAPAPPAPPGPPVPARAPAPQPPPPVVPQAPAAPDRNYSMLGGGKAGAARETIAGSPPAAAQGYGGSGQVGAVPAQGTQAPQTDYGAYLARLRSEGVQGWARKSATQTQKGWKGSAKQDDQSWGGNEGAGSGAGAAGMVGGGRGDAPGSGGKGFGYLDPRVQMVVTRYAASGGEETMDFPQIQYPGVKIRRHQVTAGWWNVYFRLRTDGSGKVVSTEKLRPETNGAMEKIFVEQVVREMQKWTFPPGEAGVNVDVRFYVE